MTIKVLFFGATADIVGTRRLEMELSAAARGIEIFESLVAKYPSLSGHRLLYSINQQYASGDEVVRDGDELAVFTAVSGG
jgi:molybdopterin synthase sulfur carrier subunit